MLLIQIKFPKRRFLPVLFFSGGGRGWAQKKIKLIRLNIPERSSQDLATSPQGSGFSPKGSASPLIFRPSSCHGPGQRGLGYQHSQGTAQSNAASHVPLTPCISSKRTWVNTILTSFHFYIKNNLWMSMTLNYILNLTASLYMQDHKEYKYETGNSPKIIGQEPGLQNGGGRTPLLLNCIYNIFDLYQTF